MTAPVVRGAPRRRRASSLTLVFVVMSLLAGSCSALAGPPTYVVRADFARTVGLFPGSFVRELGIDIGKVTAVDNQGSRVTVTMRLERRYPLPADAHAILVGDSILGERYVQFTPAYIGGPSLAAGALVPLDRTAVPVETDEVLRSLQRVLTGVDPANASAAVTNLAAVVDGRGPQINQLLGQANGTLALLADKSNDIGQLVTTLSTLTGTLRTRTDALARLIRDYDTVSQVLADDRQHVDGAITHLSDAAGQTAGLLDTNLHPLQDDVAALTTAGQTLDRNVDSVDRGLAASPRLFAAARRAYDPQHNWLPLNPQLAPSSQSAVVAARVRDSLAGLCRRLAVKQPALAQTLAACGNPNSGVFDPVVSLLPSILRPVTGAPTGPPAAPASVRTAGGGPAPAVPPPASAVEAFARGVRVVPGLDDAQRSALVAAVASPAAPAVAGLPASTATGSGVDALDPGRVLGPLPVLQPAPAPHRSVLHRIWSWLGSWL